MGATGSVNSGRCGLKIARYRRRNSGYVPCLVSLQADDPVAMTRKNWKMWEATKAPEGRALTEYKK
jgi:hypothetical protein